MAISYRVDLIAQPTQLSCWAAAFLMLERWARHRAGFPSTYSELGDLLTSSAKRGFGPLSWRAVTYVCQRYGYRSAYISMHPAAVEDYLKNVGPFIYFTQLNSGWAHALLVTGIRPHPKALWEITVNDPDGGRRWTRAYQEFETDYPPLFKRGGPGNEQTAIVFYRR